MNKRPKALSKKSIEDCVKKANKAQRKIMSMVSLCEHGEHPLICEKCFPNNIQENWEKEFDRYIDQMFRDRFVVDTNIWKWAGKKEFKKNIKQFIAKTLKAQREQIIESLSYDMEFKDEAQRKSAVKMYLENYE